MLPGSPLDREPQDYGATYENSRVPGAAATRVGVQLLLHPSGSTTEPGNRVVPARIAEKTVGREAKQKSKSP
jgi:hypothetical protein